MSYLWEFMIELWDLLGEMAPYLLFGFLAAGVLHVVLRPRFVERLLGRKGTWSNFKATVLGIPLPICSCGVLPLAASLKREGASSGSTLSFLTATPQTGVDSILATQALMGSVFTFFRVAVAFISGLLTGLVVDLIEALTGKGGRSGGAGEGAGAPAHEEAGGSAETPGCCGSAGAAAEPESCCASEEAKEEGGCCAEEPAADRRSWVAKARTALRYGLVTLPQDLARPLAIGLLLAGVIGAWMPVGWVERYIETPFLVYIAITLLSVPLYVCSTGSIPLAFALMNTGISPGAALVFLIAGPATNAATLSVVQKQMGWRVLAGFLASLLICAWSAGYLLDQLNVYIPLDKHHDHGEGIAFWIKQGSAVVLVAVLAYAALEPWWRKRAADGAKPARAGRKAERV